MTVLAMEKIKKGLLKMDSTKSVAVIGLPEIDATGKTKKLFREFHKIPNFSLPDSLNNNYSPETKNRPLVFNIME